MIGSAPMWDCVVVGGGLAGLATAVGVARSGQSVAVLEADPVVGGRARTLDIDGASVVDRGFHLLLTAYPATSRLMEEIGMRGRDLVPFAPGVVVHDGAAWSRMAPSPVALARFRGFEPPDIPRLARLAADVAGRSGEALLWGGEREEDIAGYLTRLGFSRTSLEGFFRPLFGVLTADRSLSSDAGYFRFLVKMLVRGRAAIPVGGHGMIAAWTAAAVRRRGGEVRTGARVTEIIARDDGSGAVAGVRLAGGEVVAGRYVVLATDAPATRGLLASVDPVVAGRADLRPAGVTTLVYVLRRSFHSGRTIVLNGAPGDPGIDLVCQESNLLRPGGPGPHVLLATSVHGDDGVPDPAELDEAMGRLARRWHPAYDWASQARLAEVIVHQQARFRIPPGVRDDLPGPRTTRENVILAGDLTMHPSIEGAIASGERAADIVSGLLSGSLSGRH